MDRRRRLDVGVRVGPFRYRGPVNDIAVLFLLAVGLLGLCLLPGLIITVWSSW